MPSLRKPNRFAAMPLWHYTGWTACGLAAIAVTLALMGRWPHQRIAATTPVAIQATPSASPAEAYTASRLAAAPASSVHAGVDVLARLQSAASGRAADGLQANPSNTLAEALQRALVYPGFSALAGRSDAEGQAEAAAWADACARSAMPAGELLLRCGDARLRGASYAEELLLKAADAGQPAAVLTLAERNPAQWVDIPLSRGAMLGDRVFALAAQGNATALAMLSQLCAMPDACTDARLTRNVLALLQLSIYKTGTSEAAAYLSGSDSERRAAVDRAAGLRVALKWAS